MSDLTARKYPPPLNRTEWLTLKWAVMRAEEWRGSLVGNPNPKPLKEFDAMIEEAKAALDKIKPPSQRRKKT